MPASGVMSELGLNLPPASRHPDKRLGLIIVGVAFVVSLGISFWAKRVSDPEQGKPPAPPTTEGIVGFPNAVDPLATLRAARGLTPRNLLCGIVIEGVTASGTVDLKVPGAGARYSFQSAAGQGPQPPRVPGQVPRRDLCGRQQVELRAKGLYAAPDHLAVPCLPTQPDALPEPRCKLAEIWKRAQEKGASPKDPARIEYYRAAAGPAWRFELPNGSLRFSLYGDCRRELSRSQSIGSVP